MSRIIAGPPPSIPQFFLSTAIVMLLTISSLLWLNLRPTGSSPTKPEATQFNYCIIHGWPHCLFVEVHRIDLSEIPFRDLVPGTSWEESNPEMHLFAKRQGIWNAQIFFDFVGVVVNSIVGLLILFAVYSVCNRIHRSVEPQHLYNSYVAELEEARDRNPHLH